MSVLGTIGEGLAELTLGTEQDSAGLGVGGDAANLCVMATRLGTPARLLGRVGDDALGRRLTDFWSRQGVDLASVRTDPDAPTGLYISEPGPGAGRRFTYLRAGSAGSRLDREDLDPSFLDGLGVLAVTGITLAVSASSAATAHAAIAEAKRREITVACVLNHRPALVGKGGDVEELADLAATSEIVVGSREDLEGIFGDAEEGRARLAERGAAEREIAVTDGSGSATVSSAEVNARQPAPEAEARSTTGAGDAFAGAYLASRLQGRAPEVALAWGVAAATLSVERDGCALSYPSAEETARAVAALPSQEVAGPVGAPASSDAEEG